MKTPPDPPKELLPLMVDVALFNGLVANWHSSGYTGEYPEELVTTITSMVARGTKFLIKYKGRHESD